MHRIILLLLMLPAIIGCQPPGSPQEVFPTNTPAAPADTPTPTPVWFPATPTITPLPAFASQAAPTNSAEPEHGELIFADDFSQPGAWTLGQTNSTSIALGKNELTLALNLPQGYLYSLRRDPKLKDYYLELTASPTLCLDDDEYGILFRVNDQDFYRYSLTCDGRIRMDKFIAGDATSPQPLTFSGDVPPGAPSSSRLSVRVIGKEMQFFVNGQPQFTINDPSIASGVIGVFIRAAGDNAVTVNFSELSVFEAYP